jgi:hypothetical protein
MKKELHSLYRVYDRVLYNTVFMIMLVVLNANCLTAQTAPVANDLISTEDLAVNGWKESGDYNAILAQERTLAGHEISNANQNAARVALYTAYDRLLSYMQADMAVKNPIETIADINYKKVVLETPADPILKDMDTGEFSVLYGNLVSKLAFQ